MGLSGMRPGAPKLDGGDDPAIYRAAGEQMVASISGALQLNMAQTIELNKWILASLVTLNGGAIIVLGGVSEQLGPAALADAIRLFSVGCVSAVIAALVGVLAAIVTSNPMGEVLGFWIRVRWTGEFDQDENVRLAKRLTKRSLLAYGVAIFLGLSSLAFFVAGAWGIAGGLDEAPRPIATPGSA